jgi:hypothetical protein
MTSAVLPPDGLLRLSLGTRFYGITFRRGEELRETDIREVFLRLEYGLLPGLDLAARLPFRTWEGGPEPFPPSGSGLGDGQVFLRLGLPRFTSFLAGALWAGAALQTGNSKEGLTEGKTSHEAGLSLTFQFWADSSFPEMRLHLNGGYRANRNEATGYGVGLTERFEPWDPLYPAVPPGGSDSDNDFLFLGAAVEFRRETTSLFFEYTEARLPWVSGVDNREYQRMLTGGLRWGRVGGWAIELAYDVSLALEDAQTPFTASYPDLVYHVALSRQFSLGGRDSDGDGLPDRCDRCPAGPEDLDGFADQDGCPDWDNDLDGIPDVLDQAPDSPEDLDGYEDDDGLPDPDNDADGILDRFDDCPDQAEDFDGHNDEDGCPDEFLDGDNDGIEDSADRCPGRAEDKDGFEDEDGCPDIDNDLDGIEDSLDECPNVPEDYDGVSDDDGCPDEPSGDSPRLRE